LRMAMVATAGVVHCAFDLVTGYARVARVYIVTGRPVFCKYKDTVLVRCAVWKGTSPWPCEVRCG
jgi:hypothetical protein